MRTWIAALTAAVIGLAVAGCSQGSGGAAPPPAPLAVHCDASANAGWCWQATSVTGNQLRAVAYADAAHGWAVGDAGTVVLTTDGGAHWKTVESGSTASLVSVAFHDALVGWILGDDGRVLRTVDGGARWQSALAGASWAQGTLSVVDAKTVRVVSNFSGMPDAISRDGGASFHEATRPVMAVSPATGDCWSWAQGGGALSRLPACDDGAAVPVVLPSGGAEILSLSGDDGVHLLATTQGNAPGVLQAFASGDGGATWTAVAPPPGVTLQHLDAHRGWVTVLGHWWHTVDAATWTPVVTPTSFDDSTGQLDAGTFDADTIWFAAGNHVAASRDGGASWIDTHVPGEPAFVEASVLAFPSANALVVQVEGRIYATADGGASWTPLLGAQAPYTRGEPVGMDFRDRTNGIELLQDGSLLRTADGGRSWTPESGAASGDGSLRAGDLRVVSATRAWMLSDFGLFASTDAGHHWSPVSFSSDPQATPMALDFVDEMHGWVAALGGDVYRTQDGGAHWSKVGATADPLYLGAPREMRFRDAATGLLVMSDGSIERTTDGGATWTAAGMPYAPGPMAAHLRWSDAHTAWLADNHLFKSVDEGRTWVSQDNRLPGAFADAPMIRDVFFSDATHGWAVGRSEIYATTDGGATWTSQGAHLGAMLTSVFFVDADTGWIGEANGRILATGSGGR